MRHNALTVLVLLLISGTAQAAATEHRHVRTNERATVREQWRNSNAYAVPGDIVLQPAESGYANGAMASGIAGH